MKHLPAILALLGCVTLAGGLMSAGYSAVQSFTPTPKGAHCVYCNPTPCYSSMTCGQCVCMRSGVDPGQCVSFK